VARHWQHRGDELHVENVRAADWVLVKQFDEHLSR
jgi:hypothetical protein